MRVGFAVIGRNSASLLAGIIHLLLAAGRRPLSAHLPIRPGLLQAFLRGLQHAMDQPPPTGSETDFKLRGKLLCFSAISARRTVSLGTRRSCRTKPICAKAKMHHLVGSIARASRRSVVVLKSMMKIVIALAEG
jgi:hypothetical protein